MTIQRCFCALVVFVGTGAAASADEASAVKELANVRASIMLDEKRPDKPVVRVIFHDIKTPDAGMKEVKEL